jgi:hypothetical protein
MPPDAAPLELIVMGRDYWKDVGPPGLETSALIK